MEEAHNNLIGPDNNIAFNGRSGVEIFQAGTIGNTIIENSIHDNVMAGIAIWEGGNNNQVTPILMDFDLVIGNVNGIACPYCEVFSTRMQVMKGLSTKVRPPLMNMEILHSRKAPRSVGRL